MIRSELFTPFHLGPVALRNRIIRSAAFENMAYGNSPSELLKEYHVSVARGGVGMTTVAYCAVDRSGVSFDGQLYVRPSIKRGLTELADAVHAEGAKVSVQIGHCGNMTHYSTCGHRIPVGASTGFNMYSPTFHRALRQKEIAELVKRFGEAVDFFRECHFDCIEVHAGHGYLISQFLSPYTNRRKDAYGGSLENRMRFMDEVLDEVMGRSRGDVAVVVKTNMCDGFKGGMMMEDCLEVSRRIEGHGVHGMVLTAGFVSRAPMLILGGAMPIKTLSHYMDTWRYWWLKVGLSLVGRYMIPTVPFRELYFLEWAKRFREALSLPLIYVGGIQSRSNCETVLQHGFELMQIGHVLINDPSFVNHMREAEQRSDEEGMRYRSNCGRSNYCVARMYSLDMRCHRCVGAIPNSLKEEIENNVSRWGIGFENNNECC